MHPTRTFDLLLNAAMPASRSDALMVAVGFSPRKSAPLTPRRVATLEAAPIPCHASRRDATEFLTLFRGLKPTATFTLSLRDGRSALLRESVRVRRERVRRGSEKAQRLGRRR